MSGIDKDKAAAHSRQQHMAVAVRDACLEAALQAYEDAGFAGLCHEGAFEVAIDAIRSLDVDAILTSITAADPQSDNTGD